MTIRVFLFFAAAAILLFCASCFVHSSLAYFDKDTEGVPNLLSNPGFSAYSLNPGEALLGWTVQSDGKDAKHLSVVIDGQEALQGNSSLRIDASGNTVILLSDAFQVRRYGGYYTRLKAKCSEAKGPQLTLRLVTFSETGSVFGKYKTTFKTGTGWSKGTISSGFNKPGVSFGRLQIVIPPFEKGSLWLDDAGCWEVHHFRFD